MQQIMQALCWKAISHSLSTATFTSKSQPPIGTTLHLTLNSEVHGQWDRGQSLTALHLSTGDVHIANVA